MRDTDRIGSQHSMLLFYTEPERCDECAYILKDYFEIRTVSSIAKATEVLSESDIHILIACVSSPGQDLFTFFRTLKNNITTYELGLVLLSDSLTTEMQIYAYESGVDSLTEFPIHKEIMVALINNLIRKSKLKSQILNSTDSSCVHVPLKKHLTGCEAVITRAAK